MANKAKEHPIPTELEGSAKMADVNALEERVVVLEQKLSDPKQLATVLEGAAADSKSLDKLFSKLFCDMISKDEEVKNAVEKHVKEVDRKALKRFGGKLGFAAWSVIIFIAGLVVKEIISRNLGVK